MNRLMIVVVILLGCMPALPQQETALARLLQAEVARMPAKVGLYVKHLGTGEAVSIRGDEIFNTKESFRDRCQQRRTTGGKPLFRKRS